MKCKSCQSEAPINVIAFKQKDWICPKCDTITLQEELHKIYLSGNPGRYLYVSELTNNLDKVHNFFVERVDLDNPFCIITLVLPEAISQLKGHFDGVYVDANCLLGENTDAIQLADKGYIRVVEPTTQILI